VKRISLSFEENPRRWNGYVGPKHMQNSGRLHGFTFQKTVFWKLTFHGEKDFRKFVFVSRKWENGFVRNYEWFPNITFLLFSPNFICVHTLEYIKTSYWKSEYTDANFLCIHCVKLHMAEDAGFRGNSG
jgi:hypothetical protein